MNQTTIELECHALHKDIDQLKLKSNRYSTIRFFVIIGVLFSLYQGSVNQSFWYLLAIVLTVAFLYVARLHYLLKVKLEETQTYLNVYEDILKRKSDEWKNFEQTGKEFMKESMTQAYDLDLFGKSSLFQYLNVGATIAGKEALATLFTLKSTDATSMFRRQEAVKEAMESKHFTLRMNMLSKLFSKHAKKIKKKKMDSFLAFMEEPIPPYAFLIKALSFLLPVLSILASILTGFFNLSLSYALAAFTLTLCFAMLGFMKNNAQLSYVESMHALIQDYEKMFSCMSQQAFESAFWKDLKHQLQDADQGIRELNRILGFVRIRSNSVMFMIINGFTAIDYHCVNALRVWKNTYGTQVRHWLDAIGEAEAILSLTQLCFAKDQVCFASIKEGAPSIQMIEGKHPLIKESDAVANSITMEHGSYVITGSNMSGKTTFLRTIGVNMVLFQAGAPVCATSFQATPVSIYTSMRVHDDVSEGISTFYAEILRIKQMMEASKRQDNMLVLIDEIFKGTNSADRILCAKEAIMKLHLPHVITVVSTHDFELCDLEKDDKVHAINYHFSEYYEEDTICFDYLLKEGRCTTTNARQLMKLAGF